MSKPDVSLDRGALLLRLNGDERVLRGLSSGERIYVALAANRPDLIDADIPRELHYLGAAWSQALIDRHGSLDAREALMERFGLSE